MLLSSHCRSLQRETGVVQGLEICDASCPGAAAAQALKKAAFQKKGLSMGFSCISSAKDYLLARLSYLCILNKRIHVTN